MRLGERTDTGRCGRADHRTPAPFRRSMTARSTPALQALRGPQQQVPPMYSALKRDGQPLYKLARQGLERRARGRAPSRSTRSNCSSTRAVTVRAARGVLQGDLRPHAGRAARRSARQLRACDRHCAAISSNRFAAQPMHYAGATARPTRRALPCSRRGPGRRRTCRRSSFRPARRGRSALGRRSWRSGRRTGQLRLYDAVRALPGAWHGRGRAAWCARSRLFSAGTAGRRN